MNKIFAFLVACIVVLAGAILIANTTIENSMSQTVTPANETVRQLVENFGQRLQRVSLLAQREQVAAQMQTEYGAFVAPEVLATWMNDPRNAPGRLTSSLWPDRIEVASVEQIGEGNVFYVEGVIVEVTNEGGGIGENPTEALRRPITIGVEETPSGLRITEFVLGAYPGDGEWIYTEPNAQGLQWMYPRALPTAYISAVGSNGWPPFVELSSNEYSCVEGPITAADGPLKTAEKRMVDDREYCVISSSEGAAGSAYHMYEYQTKQGDFVARIMFTLRFPNCDNYGEDEQPLCESEQTSFDIDGLADRVAQSIRML